MIKYIEKGAGLHERIGASGQWLAQVNGVWQSSDDVAVQAIIDAYTVADTAEHVCTAIDRHGAEMRNRIVGDTSPAEMASWVKKESEARAFTASGNAADASLLAAEAAVAQGTVADLAATVLDKAAAYNQAEAAISGTSRRHKTAVRASEDFAAALSYDWSTGWPKL